MNYNADLSPTETWAMMEESPADTVLIDVRSKAEWTFVGLPETDSSMNPVIPQEWQTFPAMTVDPAFATSLESKLKQLNLGTYANLCFICRTGGRSKAAASEMTAKGYVNAYNVTSGFEGDQDADGHRGAVNGWKADGLPWRQN